MNIHQNRIKQYGLINTHLACLSNQQLTRVLDDAKPMHAGIGGTSALINIEDRPVFVKKIPLTQLEQKPQHVMSTANLFNLPMHYQYGVGSAGFGAWRELAIHIMTTNWVITNQCAHFPLLYHWRILDNSQKDLNIDYWGDLEQYNDYWENSKAIRKRVTALNKSSAHIALFLEFVPQTLYQWLSAQIAANSQTALSAIQWVDDHLKVINQFMSRHGLVHFDAHFKNILTDGKLLYLSDFGLALSSIFELTANERDFLLHHANYDQCCAAVNLMHCIMTTILGKDQWPDGLKENSLGKLSNICPGIEKIVKNHIPIALVMDDFFQTLQKVSKSTPFPKEQLDVLLT